MLRITLSKAGEPPKTNQFDKREITVGRTPSNDVVIPEPGVSSSHARILYMDGELTLIDLESTNGTFVNGQRIQGPQPVKAGDEVYICAHKLGFELEGSAQQPPAPAAAPPSPASSPAPPGPIGVAPPAPVSPPAAPEPVAPPPQLAVPAAVAGAGGPVHAKGPGQPPTLPPLLGGGSPAPARPAPEPVAPAPPAPAPPAPAPPAPAPPAPAPPAPAPPPAAPARTGGTVPPHEAASDKPAPAQPAPASVPPVPVMEMGGAIGHKPPSYFPTEPPPSRPPPPASEPGPAPAPAPAPEPPAPPAPSATPEPVVAAAPKPAPAPPPPSAEPEPAPARAWNMPPSSSPSAPPGLGLARPAPGLAASPAAPNLHAPATLGDLDDLASLRGDDLAHEACARVFAVVHDQLATGALVPDASEHDRAASLAREQLQIVAKRYASIDAAHWSERIASELTGLGKLSAVMNQPATEEVFVHGPTRALTRRGGKPTPADLTFTCPQAIEVVVRRLTGTSFGVDNPVVDARTYDGAEVYAVHESVAPGGPVVTVTLTGEAEPVHSLEKMLQARAMPPAIANLLSSCVQGGLNIAICAGPGAQPFPLLAALAEAAPENDRQLVVRPSHEPGLLPAGAVVLQGDGLVGAEGSNVMQGLVRTALGLGPDRLHVVDVAGAEAADVFCAMGRGLRGVVLTTRAGTSQDGLARLATLVGLGMGHSAGPADLASGELYVTTSLELIVTVARFPDGQTRITQISEPCLSPAGKPAVVDLITIDPSTRNWTHTGAQPTFAAELRRRGIIVDTGANVATDGTQLAPGR